MTESAAPSSALESVENGFDAFCDIYCEDGIFNAFDEPEFNGVVLPSVLGGSSLEMRFFTKMDAEGNQDLYVGKSSLSAMATATAQRNLERSKPFAYGGRYQEELREILALRLYRGIFEVNTPASYIATLSVAPRISVAEARAVSVDRRTPRIHVLTRFVPNLVPLGPDFVKKYSLAAKRNPSQRFMIETTATSLPLVGFGRMLAAAAILGDLDCIGNSGTNCGYVVDIEQSVCNIIKLDAGQCFWKRAGSGIESVHEETYTMLVSPNMKLRLDALNAPDTLEFQLALLLGLERLNDDSSLTTTRRLSYKVCLQRLSAQLCALPDDPLTKEYVEHLLQVARSSLNRHAEARSYSLHKLVERSAEKELAALVIAMHRGEIGDELLPGAQEIVIRASFIRRQISAKPPKIPDLGENPIDLFQFNLAAIKSTNFAGREVQIDEIMGYLSEGNSQVLSITGMGGVGKTALVGNYVLRALEVNKYQKVAWLRAEHEDDLVSQMKALYARWTSGAIVDPQPQEAFAQIWTSLREEYGASTLVVFDNVVEWNMHHPFPPFADDLPGTVHVILTTRDMNSHDLSARMVVDCLSAQGTSTVVAALIGDRAYAPYNDHLRAEMDQLGEIHYRPSITIGEVVHEVTGGLPLAVTQLMAFMKATGFSIAEVYDYVSHVPPAFALAVQTNGIVDDELHSRTLGVLLSLSLKRLETSSFAAFKTLVAFTFVTPDDIPTPIVLAMCGGSSETMEVVVSTLKAFGLISGGNNDGWSIHRLTQRWVQRYSYMVEGIQATVHVELVRACVEMIVMSGYACNRRIVRVCRRLVMFYQSNLKSHCTELLVSTALNEVFGPYRDVSEDARFDVERAVELGSELHPMYAVMAAGIDLTSDLILECLNQNHDPVAVDLLIVAFHVKLKYDNPSRLLRLRKLLETLPIGDTGLLRQQQRVRLLRCLAEAEGVATNHAEKHRLLLCCRDIIESMGPYPSKMNDKVTISIEISVVLAEMGEETSSRDLLNAINDDVCHHVADVRPDVVARIYSLLAKRASPEDGLILLVQARELQVEGTYEEAAACEAIAGQVIDEAPAEAVRLFKHAVTIYRQTGGFGTGPELLRCLEALGNGCYAIGQNAEACVYLKEIVNRGKHHVFDARPISARLLADICALEGWKEDELSALRGVIYLINISDNLLPGYRDENKSLFVDASLRLARIYLDGNDTEAAEFFLLCIGEPEWSKYDFRMPPLDLVNMRPDEQNLMATMLEECAQRFARNGEDVRSERCYKLILNIREVDQTVRQRAEAEADAFQNRRYFSHAITVAARATACTLYATQGQPIPTHQTWYECLDCLPERDTGCCESCAKICHLGHRLEKKTTGPFYCDCPDTGHCRALPTSEDHLRIMILCRQLEEMVQVLENGDIVIRTDLNS